MSRKEGRRDRVGTSSFESPIAGRVRKHLAPTRGPVGCKGEQGQWQNSRPERGILSQSRKASLPQATFRSWTNRSLHHHLQTACFRFSPTFLDSFCSEIPRLCLEPLQTPQRRHYLHSECIKSEASPGTLFLPSPGHDISTRGSLIRLGESH